MEELGIKEYLSAYLDPNLNPKDLPTGVCFASGGTGFDPMTPKIVVYTLYTHKYFISLTYIYIYIYFSSILTSFLYSLIFYYALVKNKK